MLRVVSRFQRIAGFDRAIALASSALTALVPLLIFTSAILPRVGGAGAADDIVDRYDLSGDAAESVHEVFSPASGVTTGIGVFGALFLMIAVLSFTRAMQRLIEQSWELPALSVRNSVNGLKWIAGLLAYTTIAGTARGLSDRGATEAATAAALIPATAAFYIWSAYVLSGRRLPWRRFVAFGVVAACAGTVYSVAASAYMPGIFETYAARYGVVGVVFALISALFGAMVVIVASSALGREVHEEIGRLRHGERPSEDEVRKQWNEVLARARSGWAGAREWVGRARRRGSGDSDGGAAGGPAGAE